MRQWLLMVMISNSRSSSNSNNKGNKRVIIYVLSLSIVFFPTKIIDKKKDTTASKVHSVQTSVAEFPLQNFRYRTSVAISVRKWTHFHYYCQAVHQIRIVDHHLCWIVVVCMVNTGKDVMIKVIQTNLPAEVTTVGAISVASQSSAPK